MPKAENFLGIGVTGYNEELLYKPPRHPECIGSVAALVSFTKRNAMSRFQIVITSLLLTAFAPLTLLVQADDQSLSTVELNKVRKILSNRCFTCHGPDEAERKADLRLDTFGQATLDRDGTFAIKPGDVEASQVVTRISTDDEFTRMPPGENAVPLTSEEIALIKRWIAQGAKYGEHWAYVAPQKPAIPAVKNNQWGRNDIDAFILAEIEKQGLNPNAPATRETLIRRLSFDLTGLPPTIEQVNAFVEDGSDDAYENLVDRLLGQPTYGERWATMWLDLARYADSAGYANDPGRTIWLYRDWVINAFNNNVPFDQFTVEQLAGDLLEDPSQQQLVATAFHRNTLTQSEGGTNDEEFRNVAVVDRVNTTMQVWMGTTIRCAQCHTHKYDPITQEEYFKFFAFFNNTEDADRADEQPLLSILTPEKQQQKSDLELEIKELERQLTPTVETLTSQIQRWKQQLEHQVAWEVVKELEATASSGATFSVGDDGVITVSGEAGETEVYELSFATALKDVKALRLEVLSDDALPGKGPGRANNGNFVLSEIAGSFGGARSESPQGQIVRIDLPGQGKMIHIAELEIFSGGRNIALEGQAKQSSTDFGGDVKRANDGNTDGIYTNNSVTHTAVEANPWIEIDLGKVAPIDLINIWPRTDADLYARMNGFVLSVLDAERNLVWKQEVAQAPKGVHEATLDGLLPIEFSAASATFEQREGDVINNFGVNKAVDGDAKSTASGWAVGGQIGQDNTAVFEIGNRVGTAEKTEIKLILTQNYNAHPLGKFRISLTTETESVAVLPNNVVEILNAGFDPAEESQVKTLRDHHLRVVPPPKELTDKIAAVKKQMDGIKPVTVPIMRELMGERRRKTHIQVRGNFEALEGEVTEGTPAVLHQFPEDAPVNRLGLAQWLVSSENPLTSRVIVNRYWEQLFGQGIVRTSEEFGAQGDFPSHPELLDYLAVTFQQDLNWDMKQLLKLIVMSSTYRQSSHVTAEHKQIDPYNYYLARGPRFRLNAEMIRDQALAVSGLLDQKMLGPSVNPPRPKLGLSAAFGSSTDWTTSPGGDKWRRGLYTQWRRSLPYPSMATFDAPSRNVCTIRRVNTNTPLQALVTLNDPVYIEAAQAFGRRLIAEGGAGVEDKVTFGFRLALSRSPYEIERQRLIKLYETVLADYQADRESAMQIATMPLGPLPDEVDVAEAAAWTIVGNVLLNLDETLAKR